MKKIIIDFNKTLTLFLKKKYICRRELRNQAFPEIQAIEEIDKISLFILHIPNYVNLNI
jgi:hypothetical protein